MSSSNQNEEINIESDKLYDVLFADPGSEFESQFFLSRKRALKAQNGENEFESSLELRLKALEMMHMVLAGSKDINDVEDICCFEEFNTLICNSKKSKKLQEHFISKIRSIFLTLLIKYSKQGNKDIEKKKKFVNFFLFLLNIKFEISIFNSYFGYMKKDKDMLKILVEEFTKKIFRGRNNNFNFNFSKQILRSILFSLQPTEEENINTFDIYSYISLLLVYYSLKEKIGSRTIFQLSENAKILDYIFDIINMNENLVKQIKEKKEKFENIINIIWENIYYIFEEYFDKDNVDTEKCFKFKTFFSNSKKMIQKLKKLCQLTEIKNNILDKIVSFFPEKIEPWFTKNIK